MEKNKLRLLAVLFLFSFSFSCLFAQEGDESSNNNDTGNNEAKVSEQDALSVQNTGDRVENSNPEPKEDKTVVPNTPAKQVKDAPSNNGKDTQPTSNDKKPGDDNSASTPSSVQSKNGTAKNIKPESKSKNDKTVVPSPSSEQVKDISPDNGKDKQPASSDTKIEDDSPISKIEDDSVSSDTKNENKIDSVAKYVYWQYIIAGILFLFLATLVFLKFICLHTLILKKHTILIIKLMNCKRTWRKNILIQTI